MHVFPRIARLIGAHPRLTSGIWAVLLIILFIGGTTGFGANNIWNRAHNAPASIPGSESWRGNQIINRFTESNYQVYLLIEGVDVKANTQELAHALNTAAVSLSRIPGVRPAGVIHPFAAGTDEKNPAAKELMNAFIAKNGQGVLVVVLLNLTQFPDSTDMLRQNVERVLRRIPQDLRSFSPKATGVVSDDELVSQSISTQARDDFTWGVVGGTVIIVLLTLLLTASLWMTGISLVAIFTAVALSVGNVFFFGFLLDPSSLIAPTICAIAMGLSVNFALHIATSFRSRLRFEQETSQIPIGKVGRTRRKRIRRYNLEPFALTAMEQTLVETGKTVVLSGITIGIGLVSLAVFPSPLLRSISLIGSIVLIGIVAMSLTLVPALLFIAGRGLEKRIGFLDLLSTRFLEPVWQMLHQRMEAVVSWVLSRSWVAVSGCLLMALALALPTLGMSFRSYHEENVSSSSDLGHFLQERKTQYGTTGAHPDAQVLVRANKEDTVDFAHKIAKISGIESVTLDTNIYGEYRVVNVIFTDGDSTRISRLGVQKIRNLPTDFEVLVTGKAGVELDFRSALAQRLWLVIVLIVATAFLLQWYLIGSLVIVTQTVLANTLALGAALGLSTVIFQDRFFWPQGRGMDAFVIVLASALGYSLLTDYQLITARRIKVNWDRLGDTRAAIAAGLRNSRNIVWLRDMYQFSVFSIFSFCVIGALRQLSLIIILLLLFNLLVIRPLFLPALMRLTDSSNWLIANSARGGVSQPLEDEELIILEPNDNSDNSETQNLTSSV